MTPYYKHHQAAVTAADCVHDATSLFDDSIICSVQLVSVLFRNFEPYEDFKTVPINFLNLKDGLELTDTNVGDNYGSFIP